MESLCRVVLPILNFIQLITLNSLTLIYLATRHYLTFLFRSFITLPILQLCSSSRFLQRKEMALIIQSVLWLLRGPEAETG